MKKEIQCFWKTKAGSHRQTDPSQTLSDPLTPAYLIKTNWISAASLFLDKSGKSIPMKPDKEGDIFELHDLNGTLGIYVINHFDREHDTAVDQSATTGLMLLKCYRDVPSIFSLPSLFRPNASGYCNTSCLWTGKDDNQGQRSCLNINEIHYRPLKQRKYV